MTNFLRPVLVVAMVASSFAAMSQSGSTWSDGSSWSGGDLSCASSDGSRRSASLQVVGLTTDQRLICFNENKPGEARNIGAVRGLAAGDMLIGMDYRVQDNKLYGVTQTGGVYILDTADASAYLVNRLSVPLMGASFGVDFNPVADRLRIVSDTGQNLRHNVNAGGVTVTDDPLDYPPPTILNSVGPNATGVTGSAYTNNDLDASTSTTLYAMDTNLDQVALQSPPNDGTLAATGKLGVDVTAPVGFDIYSTIRNGVTVNVQALASLQVGAGVTSFYSVSLPTGKATLRGAFSAQNKVIGIAIPLNQL